MEVTKKPLVSRQNAIKKILRTAKLKGFSQAGGPEEPLGPSHGTRIEANDLTLRGRS